MATRNEIHDLCRRYMAAVSAGDLETLEAVFAPDAEQQEPVGTTPNVGWPAIRAFFAQYAQVSMTMSPLGPVTVVGDRAVFQAHVRVETPQGLREFVTSDVIRVDDSGRIAEILAFPDRESDPYEAPPVRQPSTRS